MGFSELPEDLKNIVSSFAFECKWKIVENDLEMCEVVQNMDLSKVFTREAMWSSRYNMYMPNPLLEFEPISNFTGSWADYVDWHAVHEFMWRLDFRRKYVKLVHSRAEWRYLFKTNWRNVEHFDNFYRFLLYTRIPCFKPRWKPAGFSCLQSYRSPFISARWWVEELV